MAVFLEPDKTRIENGILIKEKIIPDGNKLKPNRPLASGTPEYITIHNTPDINEARGTTDAEQYARATFNGNMNNVSVHYYIDESDCWQILRENEMGYHSADGNDGPGNSRSLAIEIIMDGSGRDYDVKAEDRGAKLAAALLVKYGLGIDRLATHNRWYSPKYCPCYILPHWDKFKAKVQEYMSAIKKAEEATKTLYRVQIGAFHNLEYAKNMANEVRKAGFEAAIIVAEYPCS